MKLNVNVKMRDSHVCRYSRGLNAGLCVFVLLSTLIVSMFLAVGLNISLFDFEKEDLGLMVLLVFE